MEARSGRERTGNLSYYKSTGDEGSDLFFDRFPSGTYVIDIPMHVVHEGTVAGGNASFQSYYAPSFSAGSSGGTIRVE